MNRVATRTNADHQKEKLPRYLNLTRSLRPHNIDHQPENRQDQESPFPDWKPFDFLSVLLEGQDVQREVEHGQADSPEDSISYWANRLAVSESSFEDVATFVPGMSVVVLFGEGLALLKEMFPLLDKV
jgi:hypothetical protein